MKRIRNLSLAALAALSLTASIGVGSASASAFVAGASPGTIEGEQIGYLMMKNGGQEIRCSFKLTGPMSAAVFNTQGFVVEAKQGCETRIGSFGWEANTLEMKGCGLTFHSAGPTEAGNFAGTFDIGPPGCGPIRLDRNNCDITIPSQSGLELELKNTVSEAGIKTVQANLHSLVSVSFESEFCGGSSIWLEGSWTLAAKIGANQTHLRMAQVGGYLGAKGFEAEEYPALFTGNQSPANTLGMGSRQIECSEVGYETSPTASSTNWPLKTKYGGCKTKFLQATLTVSTNLNSCGYVLNSSGTMDVSCGKSGDAIEYALYGGQNYICTFKVGAQKGVGGIEYTNVGEGNTRGIKVGFNVKSLEYSIEGKTPTTCGETGKHTNGLYSGGTTLLD